MSVPLHGIASIVYNIKVAETTKRHGVDKAEEHPYMLVATPFAQFREKKDLITHQLYAGLLGTLGYTKQTWYIKADFAGARVRQTGLTCVSRMQSDDLLFTGGYSYVINSKAEITFSGLLGFPTHKDRSVAGPQFGYGHVGLGGQIDADYIYSQSFQHSLRPAVRLIHFFPRTADMCHLKVFTGNLVDVYIAFHNTFGKHSCDFGYDFTALFGTRVSPALPDYSAREDFKRSSFFGTYKYDYLIHRFPTSFTLALSYGFDMKPKRVNNKYVVTLWGSWSMSF